MKEGSLTADELVTCLDSGLSGHVRVADVGPLEVCGEPRIGRWLMAHGAGAGSDSAFLVALRERLAEEGVQTLAIEFEYMQRMRRENRRRPPPRVDMLVDELSRWCDIVSRTGAPPVWLGGKSMGGRVASLLAARDGAPGLILCGYPFHPPGKPERTRLDHWPDLRCPTLVLQGTRDPFGRRDEVERYALPTVAHMHYLEDGEHDWKPRKASGRSQSDLIDEAAGRIAAFMSASR
ncbi:alpha/beta family hydrolase [Litchfieldella xinjiangensis]|uniref:alpha/beta family hydrolase n=1 Tax=Litchfieldella xinjiangensis TaxID=1166948 RepID=UPI000694B53B|nr:alpha/beta family hydrolase [Halomonas xinjiangensis]